jgi:hypothetical protein
MFAMCIMSFRFGDWLSQLQAVQRPTTALWKLPQAAMQFTISAVRFVCLSCTLPMSCCVEAVHM